MSLCRTCRYKVNPTHLTKSSICDNRFGEKMMLLLKVIILIVRKIKQHLLTKYKAPCFKHHGSLYSEVGVADIIGCLPFQGGRMIALEVKTPKGKATLAQLNWIYKYKCAGAIAGVVRSIKDVDELIGNSYSLDKLPNKC